MSGLTHFDAQGQAHMVDVSDKPVTARVAVARGHVVMSAATLDLITSGTAKKGDVLGIARLAGIMGAKKTADLIPLCHPLPIDAVSLDLAIEQSGDFGGIRATATVATTHGTGVEMEALTAVSAALLTVYDMAKGLDRTMRIDGIRLLRKSGGRSGDFVAE